MRIRKLYLVALVTYLSVFTSIFAFSYLNRLFIDVGMLITPESMEAHQKVIDNYFSVRMKWMTSNLGEYLFKHYNTRKPSSFVVMERPKKGYYSILIWRHQDWLKNRYGGQYKENSLLGCSVSNCKFEENPDTSLSNVDAVVVHLQHLQNGILPKLTDRKPFQRWIFWADESPLNTFFMAEEDKTPTFSELADIFNWSMTYRSDSDVPVPYGRTIPLPYPKLNLITNEDLKDLVPHLNQKRFDVLAATILSYQCEAFSIWFVERIRRFLKVETFVNCTKTTGHSERCPDSDYPVTSEYLFYIAIENSNCRQFISEKIFHYAYSKGSIPVIVGIPLEDCVKLLPPHSFLHVDNFASVKHLAREMYAISDDLSKLLSYHTWRNNFEVVEEHGFFGRRSLAKCRLCEALNYNDRSIEIYGEDDIRLYLDPDVCCVSRLVKTNSTL